MPLDPGARDQVIEAVRRFVAERLRPNEARLADENRIPAEILTEMRELGLFGLSTPEEYGGLGLSMEDEVLLMFELGRASPAFRSAIGTNVGIGSQALVMFGSESQRSRYLPRIASGDLIASFCLTEAQAGSDSGSVQTTATRDGDHYVLNGSKRYITNADRADLFTVMARTNPEVRGAAGITAFLVERHADGVSVGKPEKKMGQHGANICDVNFDQVVVPLENRIGQEGEGFKIAMQVLDRGRIHIASVCVGSLSASSTTPSPTRWNGPSSGSP